jgi:DNA repair exonuclease SbcCD nuclease subunit
MTRIIFCTDTHFRNKSPFYRKDDILSTSLSEFEQVLKIASEKPCSIIIHGGDLFDSISPSDIVANKVAELLHKYSVPVLYTVGNHDVQTGNRTVFDAARVGLYRFFGNFSFLGQNPKVYGDCVICGYDYTRKNEVIEHLDPVSDFNLRDKGMVIICVIHAMVTDENEIIVGGKRKTIRWDSITTTADVVLCGHYHPGFGKKVNSLGSIFVGPGALARQSITDKDRGLQVAEIIIDKGKAKVKLIPLVTDKTVFDLEKFRLVKADGEKKMRFLEDLEKICKSFSKENFLEIMASIKENDLGFAISEKMIEHCCKKIEEAKK